MPYLFLDEVSFGRWAACLDEKKCLNREQHLCMIRAPFGAVLPLSIILNLLIRTIV